jgi:hypothetical protein
VVIFSVRFLEFILAMVSLPLSWKSFDHRGHEGLVLNIPNLRVVQVRDLYLLLSCQIDFLELRLKVKMLLI